MAAYSLIPDGVLDEQLGIIATADRLFIVSDGAVDYEDMSVTNMLAQATLTPGVGNGNFTLDDGDTSGRKLILGAINGIEVINTGDALMYCLALSGSSKILLVKPLTVGSQQTVTDGNLINWQATDVCEARDLA